MGILFDFERLIRKYGTDCKLLRTSSNGSYIGGNWVPEQVPIQETISGAVIPMMERKVYQSGGMYTEQDREFITLSEIALEPEVSIVYKGMKYQVQGNTDYSDYAGFYAYNLKRVGAFDRAETNQSGNNGRS